jgi:hypothetical protein
MRTIVISNMSHALLEAGSPAGALLGALQLSDSSWEIDLDEDLALALDRLSGDPDRAIQMLCSPGAGHA